LRSAAPGRVALADGAATISYGELVPRLEQDIDWLGATGAERFALLADNGVRWALADLALHLAGRLCVPLPASFTPAQMTHALDDAGIDALLTDDVASARTLLPGWRVHGNAPGSWLTLLRRTLDPFGRVPLPSRCAKITYTSGSTSSPKGVCLSSEHLENVAAALAAATLELDIEKHLCVLPLATLLENVAGLYAPLLAGATCTLPGAVDTGMSYAGLDARKLLATLTRHAPNSLILVPELLQVLVAASEQGWQAPASLRFIAVGGAAVSRSLLRRAETARLPVYEGYGLSECGSVVCLNTPQARRPGTVGRPLGSARVRIDATGQVCVAGSAMLGYLGDAPRNTSDEIQTGDRGEFDADGYLRLQGRAGNVFITSFGRNVAPEWIECEISQRLGGKPVVAYGEARPHVTVLVGAAPAELDAPAIEAAIVAANAELPAYAQVRHWVRAQQAFTTSNGMLTANGRLRRREILSRHADLLDAVYRAALAS
jgi:long-chain acyl-CoA synthetase